MNELFTEKYRPDELDGMILPDRIKSEVKGGLQQNMLLYSSAGRGKTTLAKILAKGFDTLYINCSDQNGIATIRDDITDFCSSRSVLGDGEAMKCVILDEMDGASDSFYKALRATIEKFANSARFIGTCNYINKIPEPIQSRFQCINFEFVSKEEEKRMKVEYIKRVIKIFSTHGISISQEAAIEFVNRNFPDMRSILNKIQSFVVKGITKIQAEDLKSLNYSFNDLFKILLENPNPEANYKFILSNYATKVDDVLASLGAEFPDYVRENKPELLKKLPQVIVTVAKYQAQRVQVIDPVVSLLACCFELQTLLS